MQAFHVERSHLSISACGKATMMTARPPELTVGRVLEGVIGRNHADDRAGGTDEMAWLRTRLDAERLKVDSKNTNDEAGSARGEQLATAPKAAHPDAVEAGDKENARAVPPKARRGSSIGPVRILATIVRGRARGYFLAGV